MTVEQCLFDMYFIIMLLVKGLGLVDGPVYKAGILLSAGIVGIKILVGKYNSAQKIAILALAILGIMDWFSSKDLGVPICVVLVLAMKGVDKQHVFKVGAVVWGAAFAIQAATQLIGLCDRDFVIHNKFGLGHIIRWSWGYTHPNVLHVAFVALLFYLFYLLRADNKGGRRLVVSVVLSLAGTGYVFLYSLSYTGTLMYLIFISVLLYSEWNRRRDRRRTGIESAILEAVLPIAVTISIGLPILRQSTEFSLFNATFTYRIKYSARYLQDYGVTLLGRDFSFMPAKVTLDCSYMYLLMHGGLLFLILALVSYLGLIHKTLRDEPSWENSVEISMLMSSVIAAVSEPFMFNTSYKNVTLLLLGAWLYEISARFGDERAWISAFGQIGERQYVIPDLWHMICSVLSRFITAFEHHAIMIWITGICAAVVGLWMYSMTVTYPREILARRSYCTEIPGSIYVYCTEEEIDAFAPDPDVWVLNYGGPDEELLLIETEGTPLIYVEEMRGMVSAAVWSLLGMMLVMTVGWDAIDCHKRRRIR